MPDDEDAPCPEPPESTETESSLREPHEVAGPGTSHGTAAGTSPGTENPVGMGKMDQPGGRRPATPEEREPA